MSRATADLCDAHAGLLRDGQLNVLGNHWQWFGARRSFQGPVSTVMALGCNGEICRALAEPGAGRVLLIDAGGHSGALIGDRLATLALDNGWAGILVNGHVRDRQALATLDLGILALGSWPERSHNLDGGLRDVPLLLNGLRIMPGEWLYADEDGVLIGQRELPLDTPG